MHLLLHTRAQGRLQMCAASVAVIEEVEKEREKISPLPPRKNNNITL